MRHYIYIYIYIEAMYYYGRLLLLPPIAVVLWQLARSSIFLVAI